VWAWIGLLAASPAATQARAQAQPGSRSGSSARSRFSEQTPGLRRGRVHVQEEYQGFQDEAQKLRAQFDSAVQTFEKQSIALSSSAKATKQKELQRCNSAWSSVH